mmetsp:Transcript_5278/g.10823  ORF Transcript_5278/g.10823 Transcript_5278/m.10823 type:complete len:105 (+) Transcript_5278:3271-3585(+)
MSSRGDTPEGESTKVAWAPLEVLNCESTRTFITTFALLKRPGMLCPKGSKRQLQAHPRLTKSATITRTVLDMFLIAISVERGRVIGIRVQIVPDSLHFMHKTYL